MCGSLKLECHGKVEPNGFIETSNFEVYEGRRQRFKWVGFARLDGTADGKKTLQDQWNPKEWRLTILKISGFTEQGHFVPARRIGVLLSDEKGVMKVLTRPPRTGKEVRVHHRWPSRVPKTMSIQKYLDGLNRHTSGQFQLAS